MCNLNVCRKFHFLILLTLLTHSIKYAFSHSISEEDIAQTIEEKLITCGSAIRVQNVMTKFNLFSNRLTWGSGSNMQIITSVKDTDINDSLFLIKEGHEEKPCETGAPITCNSIIRLEHANTGKNIHSHNFPSFITDSQEVCAFGENGQGDANDNFKIICYNNKKEDNFVTGHTNFFLQHVATKQYLYINIKKSLFNEYNCRGCPILNHREVSCTATKDKQSLWKVIGGIIYNNNNVEEDHVEVKTEDL